jgi:hypothetical protein
MIKQMIFFVLAAMIPVLSAGAQDDYPQRSDIVYEVTADSLERNNNPQDLTITINCQTSESINSYLLKLKDTDVLWTIVTAEKDEQPLWLIMEEGRADRDDILAWNYDQEEKVLRFFPQATGITYRMNLVLRLNLLKSHAIQKSSVGQIVLLVESGGEFSRCSSTEDGNQIGFR